jgi:hypothetical protein
MRAHAVCAAAVLAVPVAAGAFARTEACPGAHLWWRGAPPVVHLEVNVGALTPGCASAAEVLGAVAASLPVWSPACTGFAFDVAAVPTTSTDVGYVKGGTNQNLVVFRGGRCSDVVPANDPCTSGSAGRTCADAYDCWDDALYGTSTIALTTVSYDARTGEILDTDVELRGWDGRNGTGTSLTTGAPTLGEYFTCAAAGAVCTTYGQTACVARDVQNTITHEAGHALGLAHSALRTATMYPVEPMGEILKRDLDPDDEAGVCAIYPAGVAAGPDGTCGTSAGPPSSGGCSHAGSGSGAAAVLALLAAVARWRRVARAA